MEKRDKVVRISGQWGSKKKNYEILDIVKVTKTGRLNLSDGTVLNLNG